MDDWEIEPEPPQTERPRDSKIDEAKATLMAELFNVRGGEVFYARQIEIMFERRFFHWITSKALHELFEEGSISSNVQKIFGSTTAPGPDVRFYFAKNNRYWRRRATKMRARIAQFSVSSVTRAIGAHGELMFDAAMSAGGFLVLGKNVREWEGKKWSATEHTLDRVYGRDGVAYGAEIKNTLQYIAPDELDTKIEIARHLGLKPLLITRRAPANYIYRVFQAGGYTMVFENQLYPFGLAWLAEEIKEDLGLPVGCPASVPEGVVRQFERWHMKKLEVR